MILYHYSILNKLSAIQKSGKILTSPKEPLENETPLAWLSSNPDWENTANKMVLSRPSGFIALNKEQTRLLGNGLIRFKFNTDTIKEKVCSWNEIVTNNFIPESMVNQLVINGGVMGGNHEEWYGSVEPLDINQAQLQVYKPIENKWVDFHYEDS